MTEPTRYYNVLDLIPTSNPTLVSKVNCIPGFSDHDIVSIEVAIKPTQAKQKQLWSDITDKLDQRTDQCIPSKFIKGKPPLPWISREIKRLIHKRNKYYKAYRKTGNSQLRENYVSLRHAIKMKTKDSHATYLEGLLGMDGQNN